MFGDVRKWRVRPAPRCFPSWGRGGGARIPEVHLLEEHTGIPEPQAVPEVPVDEEMFLGRLMTAGFADSVRPRTTPCGGEESYARLAACGLLRAPQPRHS